VADVAGQIMAEEELTLIVGVVTTVIVVIAEFTQVFKSVPVTVYVSVTLVFEVTRLPVELLKYMEGFQVYVSAPFTVSVPVIPEHILKLEEVVITGKGLTWTEVVVEFTQPFTSVPTML
jgi:hypothetical protein